MTERAEILVIGDVHGCWNERDVEFLQRGSQAQVLFVGDLGDEDVAIVRAIQSLPVPKSVMLGNHDAWQSFSNKRPTEKLQRIVDILGVDHLGYAVRDLDALRISILGVRPFSWGGQDIRSPEVYGELYGVHSIEESAMLICEVAERAKYDDVLVLAHNGPHGLSSQPAGIYGKDFGKRPGGDWGDRDLRMALDRLRISRRVRAVISGHMHHRLHPQIGGLRTRFVRRGATSFLNTAVVPRIRKHQDGTELRHYVRTLWADGALDHVEEIWVDDAGEVRERFAPKFLELAPQA